MICHAHRCIFIHVRKTAGRSIREAFGETKYGSGRDYIEGVLSPTWHRRPKDYFVFASVRNPFDRLVSGWAHFLSGYMTFEEALRHPPEDVRPRVRRRDGIEYRHFTRPMVALLRDPKSGKLVTHDLLRFETLQADFDRVCDKVGKPRMTLPLVGVGQRERDYRRYYTPATRKLAEALVRDDLEAFGYDF